MPRSAVLQFQSIPGLTSYERGQEIQKDLLEQRAADRIPDTVLFLEHTPVITRGRGLQWTGEPRERHMPAPVGLPPEIEFKDSERGGDLTYHGPGQLVIYPICKLDGKGFGPDHDVAAYLRKLEGALISVLGKLDLKASSKENAAGVWVGDRKIASLGVAVRKWITYHGAAINIVNDLQPFQLISPCGFQSEVMTRLSDLKPEFVSFCNGDWRGWWEKELERVIRSDLASF